MRKFLLWIGGILVALAILGTLAPKSPEDSKNEDAAIAIIKQSYSPSLELASWNPDFTDASWLAVTDGGVYCGYDNGRNCYVVVLDVDVIPEGEKRTITAKWLVDLISKKSAPNNTEARTLFIETQ